MNFKTTMIEYAGDCSWVEGVIKNAKDCLMSEVCTPVSESECDNFVAYFNQRALLDTLSVTSSIPCSLSNENEKPIKMRGEGRV